MGWRVVVYNGVQWRSVVYVHVACACKHACSPIHNLCVPPPLSSYTPTRPHIFPPRQPLSRSPFQPKMNLSVTRHSMLSAVWPSGLPWPVVACEDSCLRGITINDKGILSHKLVKNVVQECTRVVV